MHPRFLKVLACPVTGEPLSLESYRTTPAGCVESGALISEIEGRRYPIIRGIPRFVQEESYSASFGYEWSKWSRVQWDSENLGGPMQGHTSRMFRSITELSNTELKGKLVVEFGCGGGRFLDVVRRMGAQVVGIDLSQAVEYARANLGDDPNVLVVQGDILKPPFRPGAFDVGYTIGVLHHTPDPGAGLSNLARTLKAGGRICCSVYPRSSEYGFLSVKMFRLAHRILAKIIGQSCARGLALAYSYLSAVALQPLLHSMRRVPILGLVPRILQRYFLVVFDIPDRRWRVLDTFDAIAPTYASTHTGAEVESWLLSSGCLEVKRTSWAETSLIAKKA